MNMEGLPDKNGLKIWCMKQSKGLGCEFDKKYEQKGKGNDQISLQFQIMSDFSLISLKSDVTECCTVFFFEECEFIKFLDKIDPKNAFIYPF